MGPIGARNTLAASLGITEAKADDHLPNALAIGETRQVVLHWAVHPGSEPLAALTTTDVNKHTLSCPGEKTSNKNSKVFLACRWAILVMAAAIGRRGSSTNFTWANLAQRLFLFVTCYAK